MDEERLRALETRVDLIEKLVMLCPEVILGRGLKMVGIHAGHYTVKATKATYRWVKGCFSKPPAEQPAPVPA